MMGKCFRSWIRQDLKDMEAAPAAKVFIALRHKSLKTVKSAGLVEELTESKREVL